jgi:MoaA/NifB/PqqE/SkfB family radical SAM enzyme
MGIRDDEISRLIKYAEGMGLQVKFKPRARNGNAAEWTIDGTEITIYQKKNEPKIETILSLIHELGHHVWFIHDMNRQISKESKDAFESEAPSKKERQKILLEEIAATKWWHVIYKDTNCKFDLWRLNVQMVLDIWIYEVYAEIGKYPTKKQGREKYKELVKNYEEKQ